MFLYLAIALAGNLATFLIVPTFEKQGKHKTAAAARWVATYAMSVGVIGFFGFLFNDGVPIDLWITLAAAVPLTLLAELVLRAVLKKKDGTRTE